jgi:hypothetical protein
MLANKELDEDAEEGSLFETDTSLVKEPMMVGYNPAIPIETLVLRGFPWLELASLRDATIR